MALERWLALIGRDDVSGFRWTRDGIITVRNVLGRNFISTAEINRFWARAEAGEFALEPKGAAAKAKAKAAKTKSAEVKANPT